MAGEAKASVPTIPNWDPGIYSFIGTLLWIGLALLLLWLFWDNIRGMIDVIEKRLQSNAMVKIWNIELGPWRIAETNLPDNQIVDIGAFPNLSQKRNAIYAQNNRVFIVHRLFPSKVEGQLYDILIYLVPHKGHFAGSGSLKDVKEVEYYFGEGWKHRVYRSQDREKRFPVVVSAYGSGFQCFATVHLTNGTSFETWRYIDFEAGILGNGG